MTNIQEVAPSSGVLLVEEDVHTAEEIQSHLRHLSYCVAGVTHTAQQAIEIAEQKRPDVVLIAIRRKGSMDGIEAANHIYRSLDIPVVYLVAPSDVVILTHSRAIAPLFYVLKPVSERELRVALEIAVQQHCKKQNLPVEEALRESETFLRMSQEAGRCGSYEWDLTTSRIKWSDEMCRIHGLEPGEGNGLVEDSLRFIHPEDLPMLQERMEFLLEHGESHPLNYRIVRRDGMERRLWGRGVVVPDAMGKARRIIGTVVDVTEHWNAEETLWRIMEAIRPVTGPDFFRSLAAQLAQVCQTEYAFVGMLSPTDSQMIQSIAVFHRGELMDNFTYDLRGTPCENVVGNVLCHYPTGVQKMFPTDALLAEMGIDSYMGIPLFSREGKALGLIVLLNDHPIAHAEQAETILRVVASRTGAELEREIAESALRESDEFSRQIIASTQAGLLVLDTKLCYRLWNPQMEATIGLRSDEVLGKSPLELFPSLRGTETYHQLERALVGETTTSTDFPFEVPETGRKGWLWQSASPLRNSRNEIIGVLASVMDVTERHENQQQLQRQFDRLEAQRVIDVSIIHNRDMLTTLRLVLEKAVALLGADAAAILLPNREAESLEYAVFQGFPGGIIPPPPVDQRNEPATMAAQERRRITLQELPDGGIVFRQNLSEYGEAFTNYYAVPLIADDIVHGVLEVYTRDTVPPGNEWLESLDSLAAQAAIAAHHSTLLNDLERANEEMLVSHDATIAGWSRALDLRDKETEGHSERVTALTMRLAQAMGVEGEELVQVRRGALLHDVGKLGIPDNILLKTGPLTEDEWALMRKHPTYAYEMLNPIVFLRPALAIPYCHHEKWDGTGYPNGLSGEQIPLPARIFALADVYDALCSNRPYRAGWPPEKVREHIRNLSGTHLDPAVVEAFLMMEES